MLLAAYTYPILSIFWSMLIFFGFVIWIYLLIACFADLFRSSDVGGFGKAMWVLCLLILPVVGLLIYLIARGHGMHERAMASAEMQEKEFQRYVREVASTPANGSAAPSTTAANAVATADALTRLSVLRDEGKITPEEFQEQKQRVLAS